MNFCTQQVTEALTEKEDKCLLHITTDHFESKPLKKKQRVGDTRLVKADHPTKPDTLLQHPFIYLIDYPASTVSDTNNPSILDELH